MRLFGKKKVTEHHAAGAFVASILQSAREAWPSVAEQLQPFIDQEISLPDDGVWGPFDIGMAILAVESQAIFRLLPKEQADRVTALIHRCIDSPELKGVGKMHFDNYCKAWRDSVEAGEIPFNGIASLLYDRLGLKSATNVGSVTLKSPLTLMMLGDIIVRVGNGWWKRFLDEFKLIDGA